MSIWAIELEWLIGGEMDTQLMVKQTHSLSYMFHQFHLFYSKKNKSQFSPSLDVTIQ